MQGDLAREKKTKRTPGENTIPSTPAELNQILFFVLV
jgi:hypothetical protein